MLQIEASLNLYQDVNFKQIKFHAEWSFCVHIRMHKISSVSDADRHTVIKIRLDLVFVIGKMCKYS